MLGLTERLGLEPDYADAGLRGPGPLRAQGAHAAGQRRPARQQARRPEERARLARVFDRGLDQPVGLRRCRSSAGRPQAAGRWRSERWAPRRGQLFLIPATRRSATACRSASLPWVAARRLPARRPARPVRRARRPAGAGAAAAGRGCSPAPPATPAADAGSRRARCAPRSRSSRATAGSASSCRRSRRAEDYRRAGRGDRGHRRRRSACRSSSRATRRRTTRGSTSSGSRPTPA